MRKQIIPPEGVRRCAASAPEILPNEGVEFLDGDFIDPAEQEAEEMEIAAAADAPDATAEEPSGSATAGNAAEEVQPPEVDADKDLLLLADFARATEAIKKQSPNSSVLIPFLVKVEGMTANARRKLLQLKSAAKTNINLLEAEEEFENANADAGPGAPGVTDPIVVADDRESEEERDGWSAFD